MHPHHYRGGRNASAVQGGRTTERGSGDRPAAGRPAQAPPETPETPEVPGRGTGEAGIATAEFAIVTLAAVGFAGLLVTILTSGDVRELLLGLVRQALSY